MSENVFKYPGGKTQLADWIQSYFPAHECYVEVFGGSGAVIANKDPSSVEVYNDRDGDLVQFFETLRDQPEDLIEWLRDTPHSRELHDKYAGEYYDGYRPDDPVVRAGRFWYLRETQFAAKYNGKAGYNGSAGTNPAASSAVKRERLREFSTRFDTIQIENLDYVDLISRYDSSDTFFYCDPPYVEEGDDLYTGGVFDHSRFVDALQGAEGWWLVSYHHLPDGLRELGVCVAERETLYRMGQGGGREENTGVERLVMNYDPDDVAMFAGVGQLTINDL